MPLALPLLQHLLCTLKLLLKHELTTANAKKPVFKHDAETGSSSFYAIKKGNVQIRILQNYVAATVFARIYTCIQVAGQS